MTAHETWVGRTVRRAGVVRGTRVSTTSCGCRTCRDRLVFATRRDASRWVREHEKAHQEIH